MTFPFASMIRARVPPVPTSIPSKRIACLPGRISILAANHSIKADCGNQDDTLHDTLYEVGNVLQCHSTVETRHEQGAQQGSEHGSAATHKAGAPDGTGRDSIDFKQRASIRAG